VQTRPIAKTSEGCSRSHSRISKEADDMDRTDLGFPASVSHACDPAPGPERSRFSLGRKLQLVRIATCS
jgi:hypothetical protein